MMKSEEIGVCANRINTLIRDLKGRRVEDAWSQEVQLLIERVAAVMEKHVTKLSANECSRLAWLYMNMGNTVRAGDIVEIGIQRDPRNEHCQNLKQKLLV